MDTLEGWTLEHFYTHNGQHYVRLTNNNLRTETGVLYFAINVEVDSWPPII